MAIAMVGDNTGSSGCARDRLEESRGEGVAGRNRKGCRRERDVSEKRREEPCSVRQGKRNGGTGGGGNVRGWRKQRDSDGAEVAGKSRIGRKQQQQLPLSERLAVIMRNKLPL